MVTVPMTFVATVAAILYTGARPVFVDIDPQSYTMDPDQLEAAITPHTKAILPVHLYGRMAKMDEITKIAKRHGLIMIEDAAQAHGAVFDGAEPGQSVRSVASAFIRARTWARAVRQEPL